jgi:hypothetical protein
MKDNYVDRNRHGFLQRSVHPSFGWVKTAVNEEKYGMDG